MRKLLFSQSDSYVYGERLATLVRWATVGLALLLNNVMGEAETTITVFLNGLLLVVAALNLIPTITLWRRPPVCPSRWSCRLGIVVDILFLTAVIFLRGGLSSTVYVLYFPVIFSIAIRFGLWESSLWAGIIAVIYAGAVLMAPPGGPAALTRLEWATLAIRLLVFVATAAVGGMLADREKAMRAQRAASERAVAETQRRLLELSILQEINQVILQHPADLRSILDGVTQIVQHRLGYEVVQVFLLQEEDGEPGLSFFSGEKQPHRPRLPLRVGICGRVAQTGVAMNVPDVAKHPLHAEMMPGAAAELCVPLQIEGRVLGVIDAASSRVAAFGDDDQRLLSIVAGQTALAMENARLFAEGQRQVAELATLNQIGQALASVSRQADLLELIYRQTGRVMNTSNFYIALYDEEKNTVHFPLAIREGRPQQWRSYQGGCGPAELVIRTRKPLLIPRNVEQRFQELGIQFPGEVPCSWLGVPMVAGDRVVGVIVVHSYEPGRSYDQGHQRVLSTIAAQAVVALENARLYDEARRQAERTAILNWVSTMVGAFVDLQDVLNAIVISTQTALDCQKVAILESDPADSAFALVAAQGFTTAQLAQLPGALRQAADEATQTGQIWAVEDVGAGQALIGGARAWVEVPLRGKEQILGSLLAAYDQAHRHTEQERELLLAFAAQVAIALETARLVRKTERRARELSTLYEVGQVITSSLDLGTVLDRIMRQAVDLLEVEAGSLVLVDEETRDLVFRIALGDKAAQVQGLRLQPGTGVVGQVAASGQPLCVNDAQNDPRFYRGTDELSGFQTRSILGAPLRSRDRIIGVVEVMNRLDGRSFVPEHMDLLTAFAAQAAIAIENAQLYQRTDEALARRVHELLTIAEVDHQLAATLDFESVNDLVIEGAIQATRASAGLIGVLDETGTGLLLLAQHGYPPGIRRYQFEAWPVTQGVTGRVVRTGQPALVDDAQQDPDYVAGIAATRSMLSVPILREGQVIGAVSVESDRPAGFTADDLRFVEHLAEHASIAMQNARLFADLQRANRELKALSDAKTEFVNIVAHELRAPMTSIKGYVDLILEDEEVSAEVREFLLVVQENTARLAKLVADLLDISRIEGGRVRLSAQPMALSDVVDSVISTAAAEIRDKGLTVAVDLPADLPLAWGDQDRVTQILTNLVNNAVKYTDEGEVHVSARSSDGHLEVTVADTGIGIASADQSRIFEKFFRADHPRVRRVPGTGLGLSIVKSLVEMHGGRVWLESQEGTGSAFHFTLPVAADA